MSRSEQFLRAGDPRIIFASSTTKSETELGDIEILERKFCYFANFCYDLKTVK